MKRQGMSRKRSSRLFTKTGTKHHAKNFAHPMRGGIRL